MEKKLNWFDRVITPKTKAYKDFEKEIKNTAPEIFFRDGERKFSDKEKKFMQIYRSKENQMIVGSAFTVNTILNSDPKISLKNNFKNLTELVSFLERQKTNASVLIIQNNTAFTEVTVDSEASMQKFMSDSWAKELENRTDLSLGLNTTQIDERQSHHYRLYEIELKKQGRKDLAEELSSYYFENEEPMWDFSKEHGLKVLDLAIEMRDYPTELKEAVIGYASLKAPYFPERHDFVDDSYDRGEGDYEKAVERYEVNATKHSERMQYYQNFFFNYNFDSDRIDALNFSEYEVENFNVLVTDLKDKKEIVGKITFYDSGEEMLYFSSETYLKSLSNEFDSNMGGFKYETLMKTPELVKKVDDMVYGVYGEDNPNSLDYYIEKYKTNKAVINDNDIAYEEFQNPTETSTEKISKKKIKELERDRDYELLADNFSAAKEIEHKIADLEKGIRDKPAQEIVGKILYYGNFPTLDQEKTFTSEKKYLDALKDGLLSNGFECETILKKPELLKAADDLMYRAQGKENPDSLDLYMQKYGIAHETVKNIEGKSFENSYQKQFDENKQNTIQPNINNQNTNIMETQKEFDQVKYLKDQMKYLGFGEEEKLHKDLEKGIKSKKQEFEIKTISDKTLPENKVDFVLKFNKSESGGVFINSYNAKLTNNKNEELSHNFPISKESSFTAKEAINLLEGRSVKIEFLNPKKNNEVEPAFVQFNFNEPKTDKGNYLFQNFYKNYGVDTAKIVEKSNLIFDKPEWKDSAIKSLEKGNILKVKFKENDQIVEGKAVLDPQNRNLKLYDIDMNRLNTNKPLEGLEQDNKHEKANVREQSIKR